MLQSMSRVAHCIDNGPMQGFWDILNRERYYGRRFISKHKLIQMIARYIRYYNTRGAAQSWCPDALGEAQPASCCIKSGQQFVLLSEKTFYFFAVLLTGRISECCDSGFLLVNTVIPRRVSANTAPFPRRP